MSIVMAEENIIRRLIMEFNNGYHQNFYDRFRDIINEDGFDINQVNSQGRTLLMQLANYARCEKFAEMLLAKGANVNLTDKYGNTFLHLSALYRNVDNRKTVQLIIDAGADIDYQNKKGKTPLYLACYYRNINFVYLLIYYGADSRVASNHGRLPINALSPRVGYEIQDPDVLDILCLYTLDSDSCISLSVLVAAMRRDIFLLAKIVEYKPKIICDREGIDRFCRYFKDFSYFNFTVLIEKFGDVFQVLLESVDLFGLFRDALYHYSKDLDDISDILGHLLDTKYVINMIQNSDAENSVISTYVGYVSQYMDKYTKQELVNNIYFMLSYGLVVTSDDLETVYVAFGDCELFRVLLHMDIVPMGEEFNSPFVRFCYNPSLTVDDYLEGYGDISDLLDYFNHFELKQICLGPGYEDIADRVRKMPKVSSLVELSRNVVRKYIMDRYSIRDCKKFYCILNRLPVYEDLKRIVALQQKLY